MCDLISKVDIDLSHDTSDVSVLTPAIASASTSNDSIEAASQSTENIPKTIREKFYINIKVYDSNWSAQCLLCNKIQYDKKGVTSNVNRHVKTQHDKEYGEWLYQLNQSVNKDHKKYLIYLLKIMKQEKQHNPQNLFITIIIHDRFNYLNVLSKI